MADRQAGVELNKDMKERNDKTKQFLIQWRNWMYFLTICVGLFSLPTLPPFGFSLILIGFFGLLMLWGSNESGKRVEDKLDSLDGKLDKLDALDRKLDDVTSILRDIRDILKDRN